jgi:hypothetical protein
MRRHTFWEDHIRNNTRRPIWINVRRMVKNLSRVFSFKYFRLKN